MFKENLSKNIVKVPALSKTSLDALASDITSWKNDHMRFANWLVDRVKADFSSRSVNQIHKDGDTFYMGSCLDNTVDSYFALEKNGLSPFFVITAQKQEGYANPKIHLALGFKLKGELYTLDHESHNQIKFYKGEYKILRHDAISLGHGLVINKPLKYDVSFYKSFFDKNDPDSYDTNGFDISAPEKAILTSIKEKKETGPIIFMNEVNRLSKGKYDSMEQVLFEYTVLKFA